MYGYMQQLTILRPHQQSRYSEAHINRRIMILGVVRLVAW